MSQLEVVRVCALLHDVGKLECWAKRRGWSEHAYYTYTFVKKCLGEEIAEHSSRHHTGSSYVEEYRPKSDLEKILCLADNLASGADRREEPVHGSPIPSPPIELSHILSGDVVRNRLSIADLAYLSQVLAGKLGNLEKDFVQNPRDCYFKVYGILESSDLYRVPADTRKPINDVSLWDHLKLTAAFSTCIYLGGGWKGYNLERYEFALLSGDADRISSFVNESTRLPDLNARSEIVKQATSKVREFLSKLLGPECVLFSAGGSFLAISPANLAKEALEGMKKSFEEATGGKVTVTVSYVIKNGEEFKDDFGRVWAESHTEMRREKSRRFLVSEVAVDEGVEVCDVCRIRPWSREDRLRTLSMDASARFERLCDVCWDLREKGKGVWLDDLKDKRNFVGCVRADGDDIGRVLAGKVFEKLGKAKTPSRISTLSGLIHRTCEEDIVSIIKDFSKHPGIVFAGGDDLLALVPGEVALEVAKSVASKFNENMAGECTMSAGVSAFHYKLPVYVGVEAANSLLRKAKDEGKNRMAFAVVGGSGVTEYELDKVKSRSWDELNTILEIVNFMCKSGTAASKLRRIAGLSVSNRVKAEALIEYSMGRGFLEWGEGEKLLSHLDSGLLSDAFLIYSLFRSD